MKTQIRMGWMAVVLVAVALAAGSTTQAEAAPQQMQITFAGYTNKTESLTDFPVLVVLSNNVGGNSQFNYNNFVTTNGYDLRFYTNSADTGAGLDYEIDAWDTNGASYVWVRVPLVPSNGLGSITAKWGYSGNSNQLACTTNGAAWDSGYVGVWHLNQGSVLDSTTNRNNGTASGTVSTSNAIVSAGQYMGSSSYISVLHAASLNITNSITFSAWIYQPSGSTDNGFFSKEQSSSAGYSCELSRWYNWGLTAGNSITFTAPPKGVWSFVTVEYNQTASLKRGWQGDAPLFADTSASGTMTTNADSFRLGNAKLSGDASTYLGGIMDEARLSNVARSSNYIWACWQTMGSNTLFSSYGAVQTAPTITLTPTVDTAYESATAPTAGVFTVSRGARTDGNVTVNYKISTNYAGFAPPGPTGKYTNAPAADYVNLTGTVTIANGSTNAAISVWPVNNASFEGPQTVKLILAPSPDYAIGSPSTGIVTIVDDEVGNAAPLVNAGPSQTNVVNVLPAGPTALNGSATDDGQVSPLTYLWSKQSGPGNVTFPGGATVTNTTATFDAAGVYVLQLEAFDGGLYGTGTVSVTVYTNSAPVVDAGADQSQPFAAGAVTLSGTLLPDDGLPAAPTYAWSKDSGPGGVTFGNSNAISTTATFSQAGVYGLRLTANDGLATGSDTVTIDVRAAATFTAVASGRFNAAGTWDAPGGVSGPPLIGDTANIGGGYTVTNLSAGEVTNLMTVNIQNTGTLLCGNSGAMLTNGIHSNATVNVSAGGTLRLDTNNRLTCTNVNLNGGTLAFGGGALIAGSVLNINSDSFLTPISGAACSISGIVRGTGKLTLTADAGNDGILFDAAGTWSGAWDFQGNMRFYDTSDYKFKQRWIPGDERVAAGKNVYAVSSPRTIKGTRSGFGMDSLYLTGTMNLGDGSGNGVLSPGDGAGGVGTVTMTAAGEGNNSHTFVFNTNSTYVVDVTGTVNSAYDYLIVAGTGTGTGNVQVVDGAKLTVNLWRPVGNVTLDATVIDGTGARIGSGNFTNVTWNNSADWMDLAISWTGPDLHVTGIYSLAGTTFRFR